MEATVQCGCTKVKSDHVEFKWTIENFGLLEKWDNIVESPVFGTEDQQQKWILNLYPRGFQISNSKVVSLYLKPQTIETLNIQMDCELSVVKSGNVIHIESFTHTYEKLIPYGLDYFVKRFKLLSSGNDDDDTITICCKIDIPVKPYNLPPTREKVVSTDVDAEDQIVERVEDCPLGTLLQDPCHSDVTIIVGNEKFSAHKGILAARSSAFAEMFKKDEMNETVKSEVKIEDMAPDVVQAMLEFIYTNKVTDLEPLVNGLLMASDKYDLDRLKAMCSEALYNKLNEENAAEMLVLAHTHNANKLKSDVMQFIAENLVNVAESEGYKKMQKTLLTCPTLLVEVIGALAAHSKTEG